MSSVAFLTPSSFLKLLISKTASATFYQFSSTFSYLFYAYLILAFVFFLYLVDSDLGSGTNRYYLCLIISFSVWWNRLFNSLFSDCSLDFFFCFSSYYYFIAFSFRFIIYWAFLEISMKDWGYYYYFLSSIFSFY